MSRKPNIIATTPDGKTITEDMLLGYITLFSVPDRPVRASKLTQRWMGEGLPPELIPQTRKAVNAFQVACRSVETRRRGNDTNGKRTEIEVDPVMETPDKCVYQVTSLVRDKTNEVVDHPKALRVTFDKSSEDITWEPLDKLFDADTVDVLGQRIKDFYDANSAKVPAARVREAIRKLMDFLDATNLRRKAGGVYFVPREGKHYLDSLANILDVLWDGDAELNLIPGIDGDDTRSMVERHFDINVTADIDEIMAAAKDALTRTNRSVRQDAVTNMLVQRKKLGERRERYADLLGNELGEIETKLELLDQQLEALVIAKAAD